MMKNLFIYFNLFLFFGLLIVPLCHAEKLNSIVAHSIENIAPKLKKAEELLKKGDPQNAKAYYDSVLQEWQMIKKDFSGKYDENNQDVKEIEREISALSKRLFLKLEVKTPENSSQSSLKFDKKVGTSGAYVYEEIYDAMTEKVLQSYKSNKEITLKSAENNLFIASGVDIIIGVDDSQQGKIVNSVELQIKIVRAQLYKASKGSNVIKILPRELIQLKPLIPITVILTGSTSLKTMIQHS